MTRFEPRTSAIGSDCSTNSAITTAQTGLFCYFPNPVAGVKIKYVCRVKFWRLTIFDGSGKYYIESYLKP